MDNFSHLLSASGQLPLGMAGDKSLAKNVLDATELAEKVKPLIKGVKHRLMFDLEIADLQFQGWIEPLYDAGVVKFSAANSSGRMYIQTWIEHLAACANGCAHTTYCRAINEQFHFRAVAKEEALQILRHLIDLYRNAMVVPLAWLPDLGWKVFSSEDKDKAIAEIEKNYNNFADPYLHRVFPKWSSIAVGLLAVNEAIFEPLYEYLVIDSDMPKEDV
jgi:exodeoxyribonuclease V gamma subunit